MYPERVIEKNVLNFIKPMYVSRFLQKFIIANFI